MIQVIKRSSRSAASITSCPSVSISFARLWGQLDHLQLQSYMDRLPVGLQTTVRRYKRWQDVQLSLFGKLMLIEGLKEQGYGENLVNQFRLSAYQRPILENSSYDFNISHAGNCVVCAIGRNCNVGIDIEKIKPGNLDDFKMQFRTDEWENITQSSDTTIAFFRYWTQKEAVVKLDGRGLNVPLKQIFISESTAYLNGKVSYLSQISLFEGYSCYLATDKMNCKVTGMKEMIF